MLRRETDTAKKNVKTSAGKVAKAASTLAEQARDDQAGIVIPVTAEQIEVTKEQVVTGSVQVSKHVTERTETVDEPAFSEEVEVERVPVNRFVDAPPEVRVEGDTTIIPVVEEVLVVEKRLRVKEEVRVTRKRKENRDRQKVNLRSEEVKVERKSVRGNNKSESGEV